VAETILARPAAGTGWKLLSLLELDGWCVYVTAPRDGSSWLGSRLVASHPELRVSIELVGRSVADCALPLFLAARVAMEQDRVSATSVERA
jgi:hypothetical protein